MSCWPLDRGFSVRRWGDNALYVTVTRNAPVGSQAGLGMHIEFHGLVGAHHATAVGEISYFRAIPESELEDERRDREARGRGALSPPPATRTPRTSQDRR